MKANFKFLGAFLPLVVALTSCSSSKNVSSFWTGGFKTEASAGAGKMQVLSVHKGDDLNTAEWENFYAPIEGFEFKEGYLQKIEVKETPLKKSEIPADASSIKYQLVKVLDVKKDDRIELNGDWTLVKIMDYPINRMTQIPTLQIDLSKMLWNANGGCNQMSGRINSISTSKITLGNLVATQKACIHKNSESEFFSAVNKIQSYQFQDSFLIFQDESGKNLLTFMKSKVHSAPKQLHDIWAVRSLNGKILDKSSSVPTVEIHLDTHRIMGTDGCNSYNGKIISLTDKNIQLGPLVSTKKMCMDMEIPNLFHQMIQRAQSYQLNDLQLTFFDENGHEVMVLGKVD